MALYTISDYVQTHLDSIRLIETHSGSLRLIEKGAFGPSFGLFLINMNKSHFLMHSLASQRKNATNQNLFSSYFTSLKTDVIFYSDFNDLILFQGLGWS